MDREGAYRLIECTRETAEYCCVMFCYATYNYLFYYSIDNHLFCLA